MKTYLRVASGLTGLGLVLSVGMGPDPARAESFGGREDAAVLRVGATAVVPSGTKKIVAKATGKADPVMGFTASPGVTTYTLKTAKAGVVGRVGRGVDDSMPVGLTLFSAPRPKTETAAQGSTTRGMTGSKPYRAQIEKHARANGVPVALALAVVRIESNFNPRTRGRAGEIGLMQIKPRTARGMGFTGSTAALYDPETNLKWGMKYLAGAYKLAGGDTCGTVMRYQGGHYARRMSKAAVVYCGKAKRHMAGQWT